MVGDVGPIPNEVIAALDMVRRYGCINLFNPEAVTWALLKSGQTDAAAWLEMYPDRFRDALAAMGKQVSNDDE